MEWDEKNDNQTTTKQKKTKQKKGDKVARIAFNAKFEFVDTVIIILKIIILNVKK